MIVNNSFNSDENTFQDSEISLPRPVRFWLLLLFDIPSVICSFFLLYHLLIDKNLRHQLANHIIIILLIMGLIIELIEIPFDLSFFHLGVVQPSTPAICLIWWLIDLGLFAGSTMVMAFGSVHRYLLIFHDRMFLNKKKRFIFHYSPLIILLLYIFIFYIIVIIFPPCMNTYDYTLPNCDDFPCYLADPIHGIWDSCVNNLLAIIIISIFSLILPIRIYRQKRRFNQPNLWRKQRKMTIQLLSNCILYMIPNIPLNILFLVHLYGVPSSIGFESQLYFDFLSYFIILLFPFVCLGSTSELRKKVKCQWFIVLKKPRRNATVEPQ